MILSDFQKRAENDGLDPNAIGDVISITVQADGFKIFDYKFWKIVIYGGILWEIVLPAWNTKLKTILEAE